MNKLAIEPKEEIAKLTNFISRTVKAKGFKRVILGLSGGLDSSVVAYLAQKALGKDNVIGVIMPYGEVSSEGVKDAEGIASSLGIKTEYVDISPMIDIYFAEHRYADNIRRGNKMARERMSILYDLSKKYNAVVIGTSNRTERLLGYGTIYGDMAYALNPIGELYKSQLKVIARYLNLPQKIINKVPSADLWPGQTDEGELGYKYADIDRLLFLMVDKRMKDKRLLKESFSKKFISDIRKRIKANKFKAEPPVVAKV